MIKHRGFVFAEMLVLTIGIPMLLHAVIPIRYMLPMLWLTALYCHFIYRAVEGQSTRVTWRWAEVNATNLTPILQRFFLSALLLYVLTAAWQPQLLWNFVEERPRMWAMVMVLYPMLSVIPQEIIFRSFFFNRYKAIFRGGAMVVASGILFGAAHLIFANWVAPALCLIGGLMFAQTYRKTGSLALVSLEHALYGCFLFTLGLGRYFYHGAVGPQ